MLPQHSEYSEKLNSAEHGLKSPEQKPEALNVARATEPVAIWFAIGMALLMELGIGCNCKILGSALILMADQPAGPFAVPRALSQIQINPHHSNISSNPLVKENGVERECVARDDEHSHDKETQDRDAMSRDRAPEVANWPWPCARPSISASRWSAAVIIKERMG